MKKIIAAMTSVALMICCSTSVSAVSVYRYGDWTLTVMNDTEDYAFGVSDYQGNDAVVTVPGDYGGYPITAVNGYAFATNTTVREITLSPQIVSIGDGAFLSADSLEKVVLTSSVTSIGEDAFAYTPALTVVNLADSSVVTIREIHF